ncbi:MAG: sucrase ferredoxin, partial [Chloroflexota bacterium]|nr:sucrase ferredoxin [Chloroflexota bacterium]
VAQSDIFVCTHGAIDACCATFGYPIYRLLRQMARNPEHRLRVWRCTHFGGHRFAATVLDMPEGRYWGHLDARDLGPLIRRDQPVAELCHRYRGWAALPDPLQQVAEGAAFLHAGWEWTRCLVTVSEPPEADAEQIVRFAYLRPDTLARGSVEVEIIPDGTVTTMHASNSEELDEVPQFRTFIRSATDDAIS